MKNIKTLVLWTRFSLLFIFFAFVIAEFTLGMLTLRDENMLHYSTNLSFSKWMDGIGITLVAIEIILATILYRISMKNLPKTNELSEKIKIYSKAYSLKILLISLAGITALFSYYITQQLFWFLPWLIVLYVMGKNYPFRLTLLHEMSITDEDERSMFKK
ncbi:hypothetical protein [Labilibaculum sp.]|uniref:hypothetical protein n=1 Tax=Labilibaculum sp. TaxID=2060723 RepID=UPI003563FD6E